MKSNASTSRWKEFRKRNFKLIDKLWTEEQDELVEKMKVQWLLRELHKGIEQADRGELIHGKDVFAELKQRYQSKRDDEH